MQLLLGKTENHSYEAPNRPASCLPSDRTLGPSPKRLELLRQLRQLIRVQGCVSRATRAGKAVGGHCSQVSHFIKRPTDVSELAVVTQSTETLFKTHGKERRRLRLRLMGKGRKKKGRRLKLRFTFTGDCSPISPLFPLVCHQLLVLKLRSLTKNQGRR